MRLFTSVTVLIVMFGVPAVVRAQVPPPPPPPIGQPRDVGAVQKTGTARLSGRVTSIDTGRPIRRAVVRASGAELRDGKSVSTDNDGRWELRDIPAGRFTLTVTKGGFVTLSYGQRRPFEAGKSIDVKDGAAVERLDVALPRGGAVTGRVVDEFGEPVVGAMVSPMRYRYVNGQRQLTTFTSSDTTDDLGQFRLHGLPPGDYYIAARPSVFTTLFGGSDDRTGYGQTFYPGAPSAAEASRVTVSVGQEVPNVLISLAPSRIANLAGTLASSNGKPARQGMVMIRPVGGEISAATLRPGMVRDGKWSISGITPGEYELTAQAIDLESLAQSVTTAGMPAVESITERITVTGEDLPSITLMTAAGGKAQGVVKFEGSEPPSAPPSMANVTAFDSVPGSLALGGSSVIKTDWTFELTGLSGKRLIRVNGLPQGWTLKSVTLEGADVTDSFEVKPGESISGLEILVTRNTSELSGTVENAKGTAVGDYVVVVFASDSARWGYQSRYVRVARPDQTGRFVITGLPAGSYLAAAVDYSEPGEETDPEFLERLKQGATTVRLDDVEKKSLTLRLSSR